MLSRSPSLAPLHLRAASCRCASAGREGEGRARPGAVSHCGLCKGLDSHGGDGTVAGCGKGAKRGRPRRAQSQFPSFPLRQLRPGQGLWSRQAFGTEENTAFRGATWKLASLEPLC